VEALVAAVRNDDDYDDDDDVCEADGGLLKLLPKGTNPSEVTVCISSLYD
jgi:hypothetical protein